MKKSKIINDPVYGFISVPYGLLFDLIEHRYFQRLRRIKQVSLTHYVYPGALHTRFHHALGALHLMQQALDVLCRKGVDITDEEVQAASIAILLHDIGHGPFSHTLEHTLLHVHHEELSRWFMQRLNDEFAGQLEVAIQIFSGDYPKPYLHQLVSGQLDMDRMDYLSRDSFYTGVNEGVISYDRLIKMLNVHNDALVVEEKGIYSIEKFLTARRLMYWQVYLHKTVLSAELMLISTMRRARHLVQQGKTVAAPDALAYFLHHEVYAADFAEQRDHLLDLFARLDDTDIAAAIKSWQLHSDSTLARLAYRLVNRRLFRLEFSNEPFTEEYVADIRWRIRQLPDVTAEVADYYLLQGEESNMAYTTAQDEIVILLKDGTVKPFSQISDHGIETRRFRKYYLCYPKEVDQIAAQQGPISTP